MQVRNTNARQRRSEINSLVFFGVRLAIWFGLLSGAAAQLLPGSKLPLQYGPYNARLLRGGAGLRYALDGAQEPLLRADAPWTISCWYKPSELVTDREFLAGMGDVTSTCC